jgi:hypothetical protein
MDLSVIIPLGPQEPTPGGLIETLEKWKKVEAATRFKIEVILSVSDDSDGLASQTLSPDTATNDVAPVAVPPSGVVIVSGSTGRARQMNRAAKKALGSYLWFLHADSDLSQPTLDSLKKFVKQSSIDKSESLFFFRLAFTGHRLTAINAYTANLRAKYLGLPFGDQGFCLRASLFQRLGCYPEDAPYGEDHLLIWSAHHHGVPLIESSEILHTSARKYKTRGWLKTTLQHIVQTANQALPQAVTLARSKLKAKIQRR